MCGGRFTFSDGRVIELPEAVFTHAGPGTAVLVDAWAIDDAGRPFAQIRARYPVEMYPGDTMSCDVACPVKR